MNKNILILLTASFGGGAERLILDQMKYYDRNKFNLHVITLKRGNLEDTFANINGVNYLCLNSKRKISLKTIKELLRYSKEKKINLIHTHLFLPDMYGFLIKILMPKIKLISTKHNTSEFRKKIHWGLLDKLFSLPANEIITVSKSVKRFISKYEFIPSHKIKVIYNGIDVSRFNEKPNFSQLKEELQIRDGNFVVGIVGRLTKQKGHKYLLKAVANLKKKIPNIRLLIIGVGKLMSELEKYAQELKIKENINFLGFRNDMPKLYSLMDVFCLPSLSEGLVLVIIEAMLCNTITVGSKVDGIEEIIDDEITGFLVPPKDSNALTKVLYKIFQGNFSREMLIKAKTKALKVFDFKKSLKKIEKVYLDVLENKTVYH